MFFLQSAGWPCLCWLAHAGGVNVGMGDGAVRFAKNSLSPSVWSALSTTKGGEIISEDSY
jgi:prepilin-type processing-associated H-X9-DG protein